MHPALRVAQLVSILDHVDGRKKLQKMVHILKDLGRPFPESFRYSYYGMYSQQLRTELDVLEDDDLISETSAGTSFTFAGTGKLKALLEELGCDPEPEWAGLAKDLNRHTAQQLECISTILFLHRLGFRDEQLKERLIALKPHLSDMFGECDEEARRLVQRRIA